MASEVLALAFPLGGLVVIALWLPWTRAAVVAWFGTLIVTVIVVVGLPHSARLILFPLFFAWAWLSDRPWSPLRPLDRAEQAYQEVTRRISASAREAYLRDHHATHESLVAELEPLEPPNDLWRTVKLAQLLDLRADPPQVGVGDATHRLVYWPWHVAYTRRILPARVRLEDALRAWRLRHKTLPGVDDMPSDMAYDYFFLRPLTDRFRALSALEGGLAGHHEEAAAIIALGEMVRPPTSDWRRLRDTLLEVLRLEIRASESELSAIETDRYAVSAASVFRSWRELEERQPRTAAARPQLDGDVDAHP